jgi:NAD(P)-dependent dehydrogenase (short-subunit alcohol dehydrogenase family)
MKMLNQSEYNLAGRKILITGAASGIGQALAEFLAKRGAKLGLLDLNAEALQSVTSRTGAVAVTVDLAQPAGIKPAIVELATALDGLDSVVNCAGISSRTMFEELGEAEWGRSLAINLTAPFLICQAALPWLRDSKFPSVVNIASGVGLRPTGKGTAAYAASKAGLLGLTRALAVELAPAIRVNAVCPGVTRTPMVDAALKQFSPEDRAAFLIQYPIERVAEPAEIVSVIAFLLSEASSFVTGATYAADGGRTLH